MEVEEFAWRTTYHGLHYIALKYAKCRRVTWLFLWLASSAVLLYQNINDITLYLTYPKYTEETIRHQGEAPETLVTLCNMNPLRLSHLSDANLYTPLESLLKTGEVSEGSKSLNALPERDFWTTMSQPQDDFILRCLWHKKPCPPDTWHLTWSIHGACYTYTPSKQTPFASGLSLLVNTASYDVVPSMAGDQAIKVYLHTKEKFPLMEQSTPDFYLTPGFHVHVSVKITQINRLPHPHGNCTDMNDCQRDCLSQHLIDSCRCLPNFLQNNSQTGDICTTTRSILCAYELDTDKNIQCDCPVACHDVKYDISASQIKLSEAKLLRYLDNSSSDMMRQKFLDYKNATYKENLTALESYKYRDNIAQMTVAHTQVVRQQEVSSYGFKQLLDDISLACLIFQGASILSIFEIVDFLFDIRYPCSSQKYNVRDAKC